MPGKNPDDATLRFVQGGNRPSNSKTFGSMAFANASKSLSAICESMIEMSAGFKSLETTQIIAPNEYSEQLARQPHRRAAARLRLPNCE
jgi:hypothetical protein